ncbi:hypothetical protein F4803DRAFT_440295 [Xylaria telfairii]|nr:hypothetical protein F4803DRAFT_440295 [Xylaria telfairii]
MVQVVSQCMQFHPLSLCTLVPSLACCPLRGRICGLVSTPSGVFHDVLPITCRWIPENQTTIDKATDIVKIATLPMCDLSSPWARRIFCRAGPEVGPVCAHMLLHDSYPVIR